MKHAGLLCALLLLLASAPAAQRTGPTLLVLNKSAATLAFIEPASGKLIGTVPTGEGPHEVAVTADGRTAFGTNYGAGTPGNTLSMIDVGTRKETRRVDLGALRAPHGIIVIDGKPIVTVEGSRAIARYDPAANKIDWQFTTGQDGTHMVLASRDGRTLFTSNISSSSISIIERSGNDWQQTVVRVGAGPEGLDLTPDGRELWTAHSRDGGISIVDVATKKVVHTIAAGTRRSNRLKFSPDGRVALISDLDAGEVVVVDAKSRQVTKRIAVGRMVEGILVPPTGGRAYVAVTGENRVAAIDLQKLEVVQTIPAGDGPDGMAWVN